jgi:hypothetical protein
VAAATAACAAIAAHALVDSFLTFTPTYTAFALAAGILYGQGAAFTRLSSQSIAKGAS